MNDGKKPGVRARACRERCPGNFCRQLQQRKKKNMVKLMAIVLLCAGAYVAYGYAGTFTGAQSTAFAVGGHAFTWLAVTAAALVMTVFLIVGKVKG